MKSRIRPLVAGLLVALSMPPWGWWPLAFVGIAIYAPLVIHDTMSTRKRFFTGWIFGVGWLSLGWVWMWFLTAPGYPIAVVVFSSLHGLAAVIGGVIGKNSSTHRAFALSCTHTLAEVLRFSFPFGGVPLASLGISQASSPLAYLAPLGGVILITFCVFRLALGRHRLRIAAAIALLIVIGAVYSPVSSTGTQLNVALVQGGGQQGTHAIDSDPREVFDKHLAATTTISVDDNVELVIWPENVINVPTFASSQELALVAEQAKRLAVPISVGITEDGGSQSFTNAQVVVMPDGSVTSRYVKKRRVPFGEFMPMRSLLETLGAPTDLVPRDALAGRDPAILDLGMTRAAVVISWEVFFGGRANEGVARDASFIMNPTNGSSYTWTVLQTQQVASSQLRAREQDRWVAQVSPTGFTVFISPTGEVFQRTKITEQHVIIQSINLRRGRTLYSRLGNLPYILLLVLMLAWVWRQTTNKNSSRVT